MKKVLQDLTGKQFGRWTVISRAEDHIFPGGQRHVKWNCQCRCGVEAAVFANNLKRQGSCGCKHVEILKLRTKEKNPGWTGGKVIDSKGYVRFSYGEHRDRFEHVVIMEKFLGRPLFRGETVHHKNGTKDDNRLDNLELWASNHPSGQRVEDLKIWAVELLRRYAPDLLKE